MATAKLVERPAKAVYYPESDGKPMAETDTHRKQMTDLIEALEDFYRDNSDVYVSGNLLLYYEEGEPTQCIAPDVFVVKGVPKHERCTYQVWAEGKVPDVVIELTSKYTRFEDQSGKRDLYERVLRVPEYFLYDPTEDYLRPPLQGYRLVRGAYRPIALRQGRLPSRELGLELGVEEGRLRLYDPQTGQRLLTPAEQAAARRQAEKQAQAEAAARQREAEARREAEAELARLRAELEALRQKTGRR